MKLRAIRMLGLVALFAVSWIVLEPQSAEAQRRGGGSRGGSWGGRGGSNWGFSYSPYGLSFGYGSGYYGGYPGSYWGSNYYGGRGYYGYGLGSAYYSPNYYYSGDFYSPDYSYQSFYQGQPQYQPQYQQYQGTYQNQPPVGTRTKVTVRVPDPNAEVMINNNPTQQRGMMREFDTPALEPGYYYTYEIRARWMDQNGKQMEQTRTARFQPGQQVTVDFSRPQDQPRDLPREKLPPPQSEDRPPDRVP